MRGAICTPMGRAEKRARGIQQYGVLPHSWGLFLLLLAVLARSLCLPYKDHSPPCKRKLALALRLRKEPPAALL